MSDKHKKYIDEGFLGKEYPTTPNPDNQDWKEKFSKWWIENIHVSERPIDYLPATDVIDWFQINVIKPLQSQNEGLEKENKMLLEKLLRIDELNEALQKENSELKENISMALKTITILKEQRDNFEDILNENQFLE